MAKKLFFAFAAALFAAASFARTDVYSSEHPLADSQILLQPYINYYIGETSELPQSHEALYWLDRQLTAWRSQQVSGQLSRKLAHQSYLVRNLLKLIEMGQLDGYRQTKPVPTTSEHLIAGDLAATCRTAMPARAGTLITELNKTASTGFWLRVPAFANQMTVIDTAGSEADTQLLLFDSCRQADTQSGIESDDFFGLSAQISQYTDQHVDYLVYIKANGRPGDQVRVQLHQKYVPSIGQGLDLTSQNGPLHIWANNETYLGTLAPGEDAAMVAFMAANQDGLNVSRPDAGADLGLGFVSGLNQQQSCLAFSCEPITNLGKGQNKGTQGTIRGRLFRQSDSSLLTSGSVSLFTSLGQFVTSRNVDNAGRYIFDNLNPADYLVFASSSGFIDLLYQQVSCPGGIGQGCNVADGNLITVTSDGIVDNVDFSFAPNPLVSGTVLDIEGNPLNGVRIELYNENNAFLNSGFSDLEGNYLVSAPGPGNVFVLAVRNGFQTQLYQGIACPDSSCNFSDGTPVNVPVKGAVAGIDFDLIEAGGMAGNVTDPITGDGLSSIDINIRRANGSFVTSRRTDFNGVWSATGLDDGSYIAVIDEFGFLAQMYDGINCPDSADTSCDFSLATLIQVQAGITTSGVDFSPIRLPRITGRVTDRNTGDPVSATVLFFDNGGNQVGNASASFSTGRYTEIVTDDGTLFARADENGFASQLYQDIDCVPDCPVLSGTSIPVSPGVVVEDVDFSLIAAAGSISGQVNNSLNGLPFESVRVELYTASGQFIRSTVTNVSGEYVFSGLNPGQYLVATDDFDFVNQLYDGVDCPSGLPFGCQASDGDIINLGFSENRTGIDFNITMRSSISGTLSSPVSGIGTVLLELFDDQGQMVRSLSRTLGDYTLGRLDPGTYFLRATSLNYRDQLYNGIDCEDISCVATDGFPIVVAAGSDVTGIDFNLVSLGLIGGGVFDSEFGALFNTGNVQLWDAAGQLLGSDSVGGNGGYRFSGLTSGTYFLTVAVPGYVGELYDGFPCEDHGCNVLAGTPINVSDNQELEINFFLDAAVTISGRITEESTGLPIDTDVQLVPAGGGSVRSVESGGNGRYLFHAVAPGDYYVRTNTSNFTPLIDEVYDNQPCDPCDVTIGNLITIDQAVEIQNIDFQLQSRSGFSGTVVPIGGSSVNTSITLHVYDAQGDLAITRSLSGSGNFSISTLSPGIYFLVVTGLQVPGTLFDGFACVGGVENNGCDPQTGTPIEVTSGELTEIGDVLVDVVGAGISGVVSNAATGNGISGARLRLFTVQGQVLRTLFTDSSGFYEFPIVPPGEYRLEAWDNEYLDEVYDNVVCEGGFFAGCPLEAGQLLTVNDGQLVDNIDFSLDRLGTLSGRLIAAQTGAPVTEFSQARLYNSDGVLVGLDNVFGGNFEFSGLMAGNYFLLAEGDSFVSTLYDGITCLDGPPTGCDALTGTPISVSLNQDVDIDFPVEILGSISGAVTFDETGQGISVTVGVYDADGVLVANGSSSSFNEGAYQIDELVSGSYFVAITSANGLNEELYDDILCIGGPGQGCDVTTGQPVVLVDNSQVTGIDFELGSSSEITGNIINALTGSSAQVDRIQLFDIGGNLIDEVSFSSSFNFSDLIPGDYYLVALDNVFNDTLYRGVVCPNGPPAGCDFVQGQRISVADGERVVVDDFELTGVGEIGGLVLSEVDGEPLSARVELFGQNGDALRTVFSSSDDGSYLFTSLSAGHYYIVIESATGFVEEAWDNVSCPGGALVGCSPTAGDPILVQNSQSVTGIDFDLAPEPGLVVIPVDFATRELLPSSTSIRLYDLAGQLVLSTSTFSGPVLLSGISPGSYWLTAENSSYQGTLYPDVACFQGELENCDTTDALPVTLPEGGRTELIFELPYQLGISGRVIDGNTGAPVVNAAIDIWRASNGSLATTTSTNEIGGYRVGLADGDYYLSTDNGQGFLDEVFRDVACVNGPAIVGLCDIFDGEVISLDVQFGDDSSEPAIVNIQFNDVDQVFMNGFESPLN